MSRKLPIFFVLNLLLFFIGCQTSTVILNNIPEREANEILVLLSSKGINAKKIAAPKAMGGGAAAAIQLWDIDVPASELTEALSILNQAGLPRQKGTTLLDLFGSSGLVPSDLQDRIRYQEGLSEQLANTIRKMEGVIDADVQITFPQNDEQAKQPLTASVYIKHRGVLDNPNSLLVTKIKRLVASSIPGLAIENVSVVADRSLFVDMSSPQSVSEATRDYVSIWSIVMTKDSAWRFRLIFYIFLILLFLLLATLVWLSWKFHLIIKAQGVRRLLHPEPIRPVASAGVEEAPVTEGEEYAPRL